MPLAILLVLLLCACKAAAPLPPLPAFETFALDYRGTIAPVAADERGLDQAPLEEEPAHAVDVRIASRLVDMPVALARALVPELVLPPAPATVPPAGSRPLSPRAEPTPTRGLRVGREQLQEAVSAVERTRDAVLVGAPEVQCADGHQARLRVAAQQAYVRGFRVLPCGSAFVADPVVDQVHEGYMLTFVPSLHADRKGLQLALDFEFRNLVAPLPVVSMPFGSGNLLLQVPVQLHQVLRGAPRLAARDAFVLAVKSGRTDRVVLAFVEVDIVDPAAEAGQAPAAPTRGSR